jgi:hypothetical protein
MGCRSYEAHGATIRFSEIDDTVACLCTFAPDRPLSVQALRSLAMLGAAVAISWDIGAASGWRAQDTWLHLPGSLPPGFLEALDRHLPVDE